MDNSDKYTFKIDRIRTQYSKKEIIESLKKFLKSCGKDTFGMREYDAWKERILCSNSIKLRFGGSWCKALSAAGIKSQGSRNLDVKEMVEHFKACWEKHDSVPSYRQLKTYLDEKHVPFCASSYKQVFGGLGRIARLIVQVQQGNITESELCKRYQKKSRRPIPLKTRMEVLKRDNYRCVKCGASSKNNQNIKLHVDHIIPVAKGGSSNIKNLQTLCFDCNIGKSDADD